MGNQITINGKNYSGNNIIVRNGKIVIDGKNTTPEEDKIINIRVEGNIQSLVVDTAESVYINGDVGNVSNGSGNLTCGNTGDIVAGSGNIEANDVRGSIKTGSGNVNATTVHGGASTGSGSLNIKINNGNLSF